MVRTISGMRTLALTLLVSSVIAVAKEFPLKDFLYACNMAGRMSFLEKTGENSEESGDNATDYQSNRTRKTFVLISINPDISLR